jgi:hypothetical protein
MKTFRPERRFRPTGTAFLGRIFFTNLQETKNVDGPFGARFFANLSEPPNRDELFWGEAFCKFIEIAQ